MARSVPEGAGRDAVLTIMATSDLHCEVSGWNYLADRPLSRGGLHRLAPVIAALRAAEPNTLLLDNGDLLQGTLLADRSAERLLTAPDAPHPAVAALDRLGVDAAGLGNHDFDYGLEVLARANAGRRHPVICTNAHLPDGRPLLPVDLVLERRLLCADGRRRRLRIGLIGLVPPQTAHWNHHHLADRLVFSDMIEAARARLPALRARADIVIALAHTGLAETEAVPGMENAGHPLARLEGIDALVLGHSHLPHAHAGLPGLHPAVLPGPAGLQLGVLRLGLRKGHEGWQVTGSIAELREGGLAMPPPAGPDHEAAAALSRRVVAQLACPISTHFALLEDSDAVRLIAQAARSHVARALAGGPHAQLPLLSAAAPFRTGGRGGHDHFTQIPAGPLRYGQLADLYPFRNRLAALHVTGRELRGWLERAATVYRRIQPGGHDQRLIDPEIPPWTFDSILGLSYVIDPSRPVDDRITALSFEGRPVAEDDAFIVATNSYRATGGPTAPSPGRIVHVSDAPARDLLAVELDRAGRLDPRQPPSWRLAPLADTFVLYDTAPAAAGDPATLERLGAEIAGTSREGFLTLRVPLHGPISHARHLRKG
ncbi:5'-nucleotidase C-terminal domain-containing protein [Frigidibacter sp. MR17.14]|uniref:5'-nucleotidase C-terminal domain-containing protein n=1 Tax=Frigidibacter sp. MR17.14 TaxID=3126509 RepID=UPI003012C9FA